jgi:hypothetical protein
MKKYLLVALFAVTIGAFALVPDVAQAQVSDIREGVNSVSEGTPPTLGDQIKIVISILMFILGAIAVVMIIIGGVRYTTSNGDSASIKSAKDTILYSVIGLIVAIMSYAIVNFVLDAF